MNRGARRASVFRDDDTKKMFLRHLAALPSRRGVVVHAYALMPNHFHLLVETPLGNLSAALQALIGGFSQRSGDGPQPGCKCDGERRAHRCGHVHVRRRR